MRNPILMFPTALIAAIGFFAVCSISHADDDPPCSDACKQFKQVIQSLPSQAQSNPKPGTGPKKVIPAGSTSHGAAARK